MSIKKKLKEALRKAGLNEELASRITITEESEIEGVVALLKPPNGGSMGFPELLQSEAFEAFVQENGFDKVLELSKTLQSGHDKKVQQGVSTSREKLMKAFGLSEGGKLPESSDKDQDMPEWAKALTADIAEIKKGKVVESKTEQVKKLLGSSKLPENLKVAWASRIDLESETSYEDQIKVLEREYDEIHQNLIGDSAGNGLPLGSNAGKKVSEEEAENLVSELL